jgi:hypothetical protein
MPRAALDGARPAPQAPVALHDVALFVGGLPRHQLGALVVVLDGGAPELRERRRGARAGDRRATVGIFVEMPTGKAFGASRNSSSYSIE